VDSSEDGNFYAAGDIKRRGEIKASLVDAPGYFSGEEKKFLYGKRFNITFNYLYVCI
jgi:hypothetical protein